MTTNKIHRDGPISGKIRVRCCGKNPNSSFVFFVCFVGQNLRRYVLFVLSTPSRLQESRAPQMPGGGFFVGMGDAAQ